MFYQIRPCYSNLWIAELDEWACLFCACKGNSDISLSLSHSLSFACCHSFSSPIPCSLVSMVLVARVCVGPRSSNEVEGMSSVCVYVCVCMRAPSVCGGPCARTWPCFRVHTARNRVCAMVSCVWVCARSRARRLHWLSHKRNAFHPKCMPSIRGLIQRCFNGVVL